VQWLYNSPTPQRGLKETLQNSVIKSEFDSLSLREVVILLLKMKKLFTILLFTALFSLFSSHYSSAQCSICAKTAQQMGEKPAKGLNEGIIYLAATPFIIAGLIFYRWKKSNQPG
jgi:hypothetical protein